jgi:hypothetical protein
MQNRLEIPDSLLEEYEDFFTFCWSLCELSVGKIPLTSFCVTQSVKLGILPSKLIYFIYLFSYSRPSSLEG